MKLLIAVVTLAACRALPPAPTVPFHASTAAETKGDITASLIIGIGMQSLGGVGLGSAVRVERQVTEGTAVGGELTLGWLEADDETLWMFALRGYGHSTSITRDWVALTYGAGLSVLTTGMLTVQLHGGGAVAYPNDTIVPYLSTGLAAAIPIIDGRDFGHLDSNPHPVLDYEPMIVDTRPRRPRSEFYVYGSIGTVVPLGDTANALSLDLGMAKALRDGAPFLALTLADTQH